jgi:hypothetical protein
MSDPTKALIAETQRQAENCGYTAITFVIWLRILRTTRTFCVILPVVFGALATWQIMKQEVPLLSALFTLLTTTIPLAYRASKADSAIDEYAKLAAEFTNLRDAFRQAALVTSHNPFSEFETETKALMKRLEAARRPMLTPPEWVFMLARRKYKSGHYHHDYDETKNVETT